MVWVKFDRSRNVPIGLLPNTSETCSYFAIVVNLNNKNVSILFTITGPQNESNGELNASTHKKSESLQTFLQYT